MVDTSEKNFEATIEQSLLANGYRKRDPKDYDHYDVRQFAQIVGVVENIDQTSHQMKQALEEGNFLYDTLVLHQFLTQVI